MIAIIVIMIDLWFKAILGTGFIVDDKAIADAAIFEIVLEGILFVNFIMWRNTKNP